MSTRYAQHLRCAKGVADGNENAKHTPLYDAMSMTLWSDWYMVGLEVVSRDSRWDKTQKGPPRTAAFRKAANGRETFWAHKFNATHPRDGWNVRSGLKFNPRYMPDGVTRVNRILPSRYKGRILHQIGRRRVARRTRSERQIDITRDIQRRLEAWVRKMNTVTPAVFQRWLSVDAGPTGVKDGTIV
jgi:hypothetical protein